MEKEIIEYFQQRQHEGYSGIEVANIIKDLTRPKRKSLDLSNLSREDARQVIRIAEAIEYVTGMHFDTFNVKRKTDELVFARHVFMFMIKDRMKMTLKVIGRILGGRDHSTVIHGLEKVEFWVQNPSIYKRENKLINDTRRYLESSEGGQG